MNILKLKNPLNILAGLAITVLISLIGIAYQAEGQQLGGAVVDSKTTDESQYKTYTFFSATTTSATSTNDGSIGMDIKGAEAVTLYFSRADNGGNTGSSTFSVQVSPDDGVTWLNFSKLVSNVTNTNAQDLTRVATVAIEAATSTTMVGLDLSNDAFSRVRCIVVEAINGSHTCTGSVKF